MLFLNKRVEYYNNGSKEERDLDRPRVISADCSEIIYD